MENKITIVAEIKSLKTPITSKIAQKAIAVLNLVFNLKEFEDELKKQSFVCTNRPSLCKDGKQISGVDVYDDFVSKKTINIDLTVKDLRRPWKRWVSKTMGETNPQGRSINTYTWWLKEHFEKELIISYATHIGHEIFHTNYFGYIHDPEIGTRDFVNERDVTYMIDDILEKLIKKNING